MAYILSQNNIRYTIDKILTETYGILFTKSGNELDFSEVSSVPSIYLNFSKPANSEIFIAFLINNTWCRITNTGGLVSFSTTMPDINLLRSNGNTPESLQAVSNFNIFTGKKVGLAIGLYTTDKVNAVPKIKIAFNVTYNTQRLSCTELSPVYDFEEPVTVNNISFSHDTNAGGSASLYARAVSSDGEQIDYTDINYLKGQRVSSIQFKAEYLVPEVGAASAKINNVDLIYSPAKALTSGVTSGEIISLTQNWFMNLSQVRMNVKHKKLINSQIKAQCALRNSPSIVTGEILGTGTGGRLVFGLSNTWGLKYDTIKLYYDNQRVYSDFEFNTQTGRITCTPPEGAIVSCDYACEWGKEIWQDMSLTSRYELDDIEISEFRLSTDENNKTVCAVKIILEMTEGKITGEILGTGSGISQTFRLSHRVNEGNIKIYSNGQALSNKNWYLLDDPQYVRIAAPRNAKITANYDWISETPEVYQFASVFGE